MHFPKPAHEKRPRRVYPGGARIGGYRGIYAICPMKNAPAGFIPVERGLAATVEFLQSAPQKVPLGLTYASGDIQTV